MDFIKPLLWLQAGPRCNITQRTLDKRKVEVKISLPQRACCALRSAMPVQHAEVPEQAQENTPPKKN